MAEKYKAGDIVMLKDGTGPMMEIKGNAVVQTPTGIQLTKDKYVCFFIDNGRKKKKIFREDELLFVPVEYR